MIFFSAMTQPLHEPPHRRVAHGLARHALQVAPPLRGTRRWALGEVRQKQPPGGVAALRRSARRLLGGQRVSLAIHPAEAFDRGEAHPEEACSLALRHASSHRVDYLPSEVFRVGFHAFYDRMRVKVFAHRCRRDNGRGIVPPARPSDLGRLYGVGWCRNPIADRWSSVKAQ